MASDSERRTTPPTTSSAMPTKRGWVTWSEMAGSVSRTWAKWMFVGV